jgi:hypothetical protein
MKSRKALLLGLIAVSLVTESTLAEDLRQRLVGRDDCIPEFRSPRGRSGIRLDKKQGAYLTNYKLKDANLLLIVQYQNGNERCGVIRDVVQSSDLTASFVWDCVDAKDPSAVVVGTWPAEHPAVKGPSKKTWRIDLKDFKFIPLQQVVSCRAGNYAGSDEGDGLSDWAMKRAKNSQKPQR